MLIYIGFHILYYTSGDEEVVSKTKSNYNTIMLSLCYCLCVITARATQMSTNDEDKGVVSKTTSNYISS